MRKLIGTVAICVGIFKVGELVGVYRTVTLFADDLPEDEMVQNFVKRRDEFAQSWVDFKQSVKNSWENAKTKEQFDKIVENGL